MFASYRQTMAWLHRWIGIALGGLLFAIFLFGTLSIFDREIDRWMEPATRLAPPAATLSLDALMPAIDMQIGASPQWGVIPPDARDPTLQMRYAPAKGPPTIVDLDPASGRPLAKLATWGASGFFLPFHYHLLIGWMQLGYWIVGFAAMAMLIAIIAGVVIHVRLLPNLFTYRADAKPRRRMLDLHNIAGVSALPFHFMVVASGLLVSYSNLMPAGIVTAYHGQRAAYFADVFGNYRRKPAGRPVPMAPIDPMIAAAARAWGGGRPALVQAYNWGDANAYVELRRRNDDRISVDPDLIYFDGVSGAVISHTPLRSAIATQRWLTGLHMAQFDRTALRWLYFLLGLMGCAMIGSGMIVWLEGRRGDRPLRVEGLVIGAITGPILGTLAYLLANHLLPATINGRAQLEAYCFFGAWALSACHALWRVERNRARRAWAEQAAAITALAALAAASDIAITLRAGAPRFDAAVAVDVSLIAIASVAAFSARAMLRPRPAIA